MNVGIIIGFIVFGVFVVLVVIGFAIKVFAPSTRQRKKTKSKQSNLLQSKFLPPISLSLLTTYVGPSSQSNCVVCLEQFDEQQAVPGNRTHKDFNLQKNNSFAEVQYQGRSSKQQRIRITMCGHIFHEKCLDVWFQKQRNCPICRESFDDASLKKWENKFNLNFQKEYFKFCEQNKDKFESLPKNTISFSEISKTLESLRTQQEINFAERQNSNLSLEQRYSVHIYSKILHFHKKAEQTVIRWLEVDFDQHNVKEKQINDSILFNDSTLIQETVSEQILKGNQIIQQENSDQGFKVLLARKRSKRTTIQITPNNSECFAVQ